MPRVAEKHTSGSKEVICTHCREACTVAKRAMSVVCPNCRKRLILENYHIKNYTSVRELVTCGEVMVDRRGHVRACIKAGTLTVKGQVQGDVRARGLVKLSRTARFVGALTAPSLQVEGGAVVEGFLQIGDSQNTNDV